MHLKNYDEARDALYPFLSTYLEENGIDLSKGHFNCLDPDHKDDSPSMSLYPDGKTVHCFGCGSTGGIFHVVNWIENRSLTFSGFLDTFDYLAKKYDVDLEYEPPSEEELYKYNILAAYKLVGDLIKKGENSDQFQLAIRDRNWDKDTCRSLGIGSIKNYYDFRNRLEKSGFESNFLDDIELDRKDIFSSNRVIFTINDDRGRAVGFAARNLEYSKDKDNCPKYINIRSSGTKYDIYRKRERIFGLFQYLEKIARTPAPFYIFEGYSDVATAYQNGIWNCGAIGGTALTAEHVNVLKYHHIFDIILCLDGDSAGQKETSRLLDKILSGHRDLNIKLIIMPNGTDPDSFIREHGPDKFNELKKWSAFEWRLAQFPEEADCEDIAHTMIKLIVNEASHIRQESMVKILASATGITERALSSELDRLQNLREHKIIQDKQTISEKLIRSISKDPGDLSSYLRKAEEDLAKLGQKYDSEVFSESIMVSTIKAQMDREENKDETDTGFILGYDLRNIEQSLLSGNWKKDVWICLAAKPNVGKTSLLSKIAYEIADHKENNACVLYHTIDDTKEQVLPKYVSIADGSRRLVLDDISHPGRKDLNNPKTLELRLRGYDKIRDLAADGRLIIQDQNDGNSLDFANSWIKAYKRKYPNRNIVYILDNFHKLQDAQGQKDERVRFKELSKRIKEMATRHHCCIMTTVEYRKVDSGKEATNNDLAECLTSDTLIYNITNGSQVRIDEVKLGMLVGTLDTKTQKIIANKVLNVFDKGIQQVYNVKTSNGLNVKSTINHPFFSDNAWKKLSELEVGSWIGVPKVLPTVENLDHGESDILWVQIKEIEKLEKEQTWDLEVEDTHNFIANNIFCHNTQQIEYDANLIAHLHNDIHERDERAVYVHNHSYDGKSENRLPRIQMRISKNKITSFKGKLWLDFFPACSDFVAVDENVVFSDAKLEQKRLGEGGTEEKHAVGEALKIVKKYKMQPGAGYYKIIELLGFVEDAMTSEEQDLVNRIWVKNKAKFYND